MTTDVLVVGGGLSGLSASWQLHRSGVEVHLVEARSRWGGRILTVDPGEGGYDLGPSWVWEGQPLVARLLSHFGIETFNQYSEGLLLHQTPDGQVLRNADLSPMENAQRIDGGVGSLIAALTEELPDSAKRPESKAVSIMHGSPHFITEVVGPNGSTKIRSNHVALALPPRLAASIHFAPALPDAVVRALLATPTWMAGHAKYLTTYAEPFWRSKGLSGDALSGRGPLAEIHDASPKDGGPYALFGFVGLDANARARLGPEALRVACKGQLVDLFGEEARHSLGEHLQDWSTEEYTAADEDLRPLREHPNYGLTVDAGEPWTGRLHLLGTETSYRNGGLIEGALEQAMVFANQLASADPEATQLQGEPRAASMSWDWLHT